MKRLLVLLTSLMFVFGILAACGNDAADDQTNEQSKENEVEQKNDNENQEAGEEEESFPVTIQDARNEEVVIEKEPERIVSLMPSNTEILFALGSGDAVVGVSTEFDNYPEEVENIEKVASGFELNVEQVLALEPDLLLAHESMTGMWGEGIQQIEDSGITVVVVKDAQSFATIFESIEFIGEVIGKTSEAEQLTEELQASLDELKEKTASLSEEEQKSVFVEVGVDPIYTTGSNTFIHEMLETINALNVAEDQEGWVAMNEEAIIERNPDVIITTVGFIENHVDEIKNRPGWQDITAVKEDQVYLVNEDLVSRSGPRVIEGVEELAKAIYPEIFTE